MDELAQLVQGEVVYDEESLKKYSHDASIFEVRPSAVVYPKHVEDLKALVHFATWRKKEGAEVSLTARNGGTCMSGGPLSESYVLDLSRYFNHIDTPDLANGCLHVQGGVMHLEVEKTTHPLGYYFPPYTSSHDLCGIGGMIGNNASGEKSVRYGATSKNINWLKVLLSDGEEYHFSWLTLEQLAEKKKLQTFEGYIYREITALEEKHQEEIKSRFPKVKKNAAGYALNEIWNAERTQINIGRLFVGSQGTLGITTEAELRLVPFAPASRMIVVPISNLNDLTPTVQTMLRFDPDTCETFDKYTYTLAKELHNEDAQRANVAEGQEMVVFAIYSADDWDAVNTKAGAAKEALEQIGRTVAWIEDSATLESYLLIRRKSFKMLLEHPTDNMRALAFLEDTIVPIEHYGEFLAALQVILGEYKMTYTYAGHIGDGSIRLVPLVDVEDPKAGEYLMELSRRVYDLVFAFGGSMSVDHNDGLIRTPFLERMYGEELVAAFAKVKEIFDPLGIFNPGKKVGGSMGYSIKHIVRKNKP